jgi:pimeloyl-ACP methyl ester carboxylesterase
VCVNGFTNHVELLWEHEPARRFLEGLASFARVVNFDRRGSGLSDPVADAPTLDQRMDDVRAVMDAADSQRAALFGISEGASMSLLFAATYPQRVQALVCYGGIARSTWAEDYPWAPPVDALMQSGTELIAPHWGEGAMIDVGAPSQSNNPDSRAFFGRFERASLSPGMLGSLVQMFFDLDVRHVVPSVHVPTLVLHRERDRLVNIRNGRWLAEHLPDSRFVALPGDDHIPWYENVDRTLGEIEEFLTGVRHVPEPERRLMTVLFTDVVDSTRMAVELGDQRWRSVLE